jgi:hypothetical protein
MSERIEKELSLLRAVFEHLEYRPEGHWVRLDAYTVPAGIWAQTTIEVCFQIPAGIPGEAPYGFYVTPNLTLLGGGNPNNYTYPAPSRVRFGVT